MKKILIQLMVTAIVASVPAMAGDGQRPLGNASPAREVTEADRQAAINLFKDFAGSSFFTAQERSTLQAFFDLAQKFQSDHDADPSTKTADLTIRQLQDILCAFIKFFQDSNVEPPPAVVADLVDGARIIDTVNRGKIPTARLRPTGNQENPRAR